MPFSVEQFLQVFEKYNRAVFPLQYALILLAIVAAVSAASEKRWAGKVVSLVLAFLWLWMGAAYHLLFFTEISPPAYVFGAACVVQGFMFGCEDVARNRLSFRLQWNLAGVVGATLVIYALIIYPMIGHALGRTFLNSPTFGTPCPTTIFTFGLLLWTNRKFPSHLLIIPVWWSLIGTSAAWKFGIKEDFGLLIAATLATFLIVRRDLAMKRESEKIGSA